MILKEMLAPPRGCNLPQGDDAELLPICLMTHE
jgi:hypothetical protein